MFDNIIVFEDDLYSNFYPMTLTRPVFELRCGMYSLLEKVAYRFPEVHVSLFTRNYLKPILSQKYAGVPINILNTGSGTLLVNGRLLYSGEIFPLFPDGQDRDFLLVCEGHVVFAYLRSENLNMIKPYTQELFQSDKVIDALKKKVSVREVKAVLLKYPWDILGHNKEQIVQDFIFANVAGIIKGDINDSAVIYEESNVFIDKGSEIMAQVTLDARKGPIYIGKNVVVKTGSYIEGPAYIGSESIVSRGYLRQGSNIGIHCRVGGEVEDSIFHAYSNKYHEGFVGHTYIGEWVNLGALTTTSDLKNNYSSIKMQVGDDMVDSGRQFLGSLIADHAKTGIGTMIGTGTIIGIGCNIFGGGMISSRHIPSFVWCSTKKAEAYEFNKFINTTFEVMKRRNVNFSFREEEVLGYLYEKSAQSREDFIKHYRHLA